MKGRFGSELILFIWFLLIQLFVNPNMSMEFISSLFRHLRYLLSHATLDSESCFVLPRRQTPFVTFGRTLRLVHLDVKSRIIGISLRF